MKKIFTTITLLFITLLTQAAEVGLGTYYTVKSNGGTTTASGIPLSDAKLTAAHKTLPLGTKVKVTCLQTNKSVVVTITDRGPFTRGRIIDLSKEAAKQLNLLNKGVTKVKVEKL